MNVNELSWSVKNIQKTRKNKTKLRPRERTKALLECIQSFKDLGPIYDLCIKRFFGYREGLDTLVHIYKSKETLCVQSDIYIPLFYLKWMNKHMICSSNWKDALSNLRKLEDCEIHNEIMEWLWKQIKKKLSDSQNLVIEVPHCLEMDCRLKHVMFWNKNQCAKIFFACTYCSKTPKKVSYCSGCQITSYCSTEHQQLDWKKHKVYCLNRTPLNPKIRKLFKTFLSLFLCRI